jgi:hypothetical protein
MYVTPHLMTETDRTSETLCSLDFRIPDDGQIQKPSNSDGILEPELHHRVSSVGSCSLLLITFRGRVHTSTSESTCYTSSINIGCNSVQIGDSPKFWMKILHCHHLQDSTEIQARNPQKQSKSHALHSHGRLNVKNNIEHSTEV